MGRPAAAVRAVVPAVPLAFAVATSLAFAASAPRAQDLHGLVAQLADPAQQERACTQLLACGAAAVAPLAAVLQQCTAEHDVDPQQATAAMFVLGRLGAAAAPVLPAVMQTYRFSGSPGVRRQAMWAIGELAIAGDDEGACREAKKQLDYFRTSDLDGFLFQCVAWRLELGPRPDPDECLRMVGTWRGAACDVAIARAVAAGAVADAEFERALGRLLEQAMLRPEIPWHRDSDRDGACGELAWSSWQRGRRDVTAARGLLQHWERAVRRQGLQRFGDPRPLSLRERLDVVACLWDPDGGVRELALATLQAWAAEALVALPALRAFEAYDRDDPFARACGRAADGVLRAVRQRASGRRARVLADDVDTLLRGGVWAQRGDAADEESRQLLATVVTGAFGTEPWVLEQLAALACAHGAVRSSPAPDEPTPGEAAVVRAFVGALGAPGDASWRGAMRALITLGPVVTAVQPDFFVLAMESSGAESYSLEALVQAGASATVADLRAAMASPRWMVVLRAIVEAVQRGVFDAATLAAARAALQRDLTPPEGDPGPWCVHGRGRGYWCPGPERTHLTAAFALLLAGAGDDVADDPEQRAALAAVFALRPDDVASFVNGAAGEQRLGDLARRAEQAAYAKRHWPMLDR